MASASNAIFIGGLGREPEVCCMHGGAAICNLRRATTRHWKDETSALAQEETEWLAVARFDRLAGIESAHLGKVRPVACIGGQSEARHWTDEKGLERCTAAKSPTGFDDLGDDLSF